MDEHRTRKGSAMNIDIADRLIALRKDAGLSQEDLAGKLGLSRQAISKWERAESAPDMGNLIALADLYHITIDELIRPDSSNKAVPDEDVPVENAPEPAVNAETPPETPPPSSSPSPEPQSTTTAQAESVSWATHQQPTPPPPPASPMPQPRAKSALRSFPYPVLCVLIFLLLGFTGGFWGAWVVFLTIPFYYWVARVIEEDPNFQARHSASSRESDPTHTV